MLYVAVWLQVWRFENKRGVHVDPWRGVVRDDRFTLLRRLTDLVQRVESVKVL